MTRRRTGADHLHASLRRLANVASGREPRRPGPEPGTDWERAAEARLSAIERQLASQNRLLLFTLVSILAELLYRVVIP